MVETAECITVETTRFGTIEVPAKHRVSFPEGLLGFSQFKEYVFLEDHEAPPFFWMQSLEDPDLAFVTIDPLLFVPDYQVEVKESEIRQMELASLQEAKVMVIVVVRERPEDITANLQGPLVINPKKHIGKQLVQVNEKYPLRYPILTGASTDAQSGADQPSCEEESS